MSRKYSNFDEPILIVEDEVDFQNYLQEVISDLGLRVLTAKTGMEALAILNTRERPCLILSDFMMPEMDGLQLCQEVRKIRSDVPFILTSGHVDKGVALNSIHIGVTDVIEKSSQLDVFQELIQKYVDARITAIENDRRETEEITELFVEEASTLFEGLENQILRLEEDPLDRSVVDMLFRNVHSVKGGAAAIPACKSLAKVGHCFESCLSLIKNGSFRPNSEDMELFLFTSDLCQQLIRLIRDKKQESPAMLQSIDSCIGALGALMARKSGDPDKASNPNPNGPMASVTLPSVSTFGQNALRAAHAVNGANSDNDGVWVANDKLDAFMKLSGEMIVLKNYFQVLSLEPELRGLSSRVADKLTDFSYSLSKITDHLQDKIMSIRKVTLERALSKLPRIFREVTKKLEKKVQLVTEGFELGVDRTIANVVSTCMTHMLRNAIDHGIEKTEVRLEAGKPAEGKITITAKEEKGTIYVNIFDDGGGIDRERVIRKAIEKGLLEEHKRAGLSDEEAFGLLFLPGFSTAEKVTEISGRGVGMDVVKSEIQNIKGKIKIHSELGKGSRFSIEIPVPKTVMVEQTVLVRSGETMIAVPLNAIAQLTSTRALTTSDVGQEKTCQFQGKTVSLKSFSSFGGESATPSNLQLADASVVILQHKNNYMGLLVDCIHDQLEAVIRPFDKVTSNFPGFKGTTVLSDDSIAYVVAPDEFVSLGLGMQKNNLAV
jgi:two-component system chemotaxis sensor kinase CheA